MRTDESAEPVEFFTISSSLYFPGFVGLVNSLRLAGHHEPVTVLERGMTEAQKATIRPHCRIVSLNHTVSNPCHLTAYPSKIGFGGIAVFIDSDALVVGRLDEPISAAAAGKIAMFRDIADSRFFPEWGSIFGLREPLQPRTYFNTGFVAFSTTVWPDLLQRWWEALRRIWDSPSFMEGASMGGSPVSQPDQDALNALLMSEFPEGAVQELPPVRNAFPFGRQDIVISDLRRMACQKSGEDLWIIQASGSPKPWTWVSLRSGRKYRFYLPLLRRALAGEAVAIRPPPNLLPPWLRPGPMGELAFRGVSRWLESPGMRRGFRLIRDWRRNRKVPR